MNLLNQSQPDLTKGGTDSQPKLKIKLVKQRSASGQDQIDSARNKSINQGNLSTIEYFKNMPNLQVKKDMKLPIKIKRTRISKDID